MKAVALKNLVVRSLGADAALAQLGLRRTAADLERGHLTVRIQSTTFNVLKPGRLEPYSHGWTCKINLFAKRGENDYDYTAEADTLKDAVNAAMMAVINANQNEGISKAWVMYSDGTQREQMARDFPRPAAAPAAATA